MKLIDPPPVPPFDASAFLDPQDLILDAEEDGPDGLEEATAAVLAAIAERVQNTVRPERRTYPSGLMDPVDDAAAVPALDEQAGAEPFASGIPLDALPQEDQADQARETSRQSNPASSGPAGATGAGPARERDDRRPRPRDRHPERRSDSGGGRHRSAEGNSPESAAEASGRRPSGQHDNSPGGHNRPEGSPAGDAGLDDPSAKRPRRRRRRSRSRGASDEIEPGDGTDRTDQLNASPNDASPRELSPGASATADGAGPESEDDSAGQKSRRRNRRPRRRRKGPAGSSGDDGPSDDGSPPSPADGAD